jgi:hypothetical protein
MLILLQIKNLLGNAGMIVAIELLRVFSIGYLQMKEKAFIIML